MMNTKRPVGLIAAALAALALLFAACSAESERNLAPDYAKNAKAMKAELEALARDYGLRFVANEDLLRKEMENGSFSKDSMRHEFAMMSKINGYYPFVATRKNQLVFNSNEARLARFRRPLLPTRDVTNGKWPGTQQEPNRCIALCYNLSWLQPATATKNGQNVRFVSLNASDGFGGTYNNDMTCRPDKSGKGFDYRFSCNISRGLGTYVYHIKGFYRPGASQATVAALESVKRAQATRE